MHDLKKIVDFKRSSSFKSSLLAKTQLLVNSFFQLIGRKNVEPKSSFIHITINIFLFAQVIALCSTYKRKNNIFHR